MAEGARPELHPPTEPPDDRPVGQALRNPAVAVVRIRDHLEGDVLLFEPGGDLIPAVLGTQERTVHLVMQGKDGPPVWIVALVENGMVKIMEETQGPYCEPCSADFYAKAVEACGEPREGTYAGDFRERMRPAKAA